MWASHGKNITQPNNLPLVVFFPQGATRELSHFYSPKMPIVSLHQENFSELTDFFNASAVFFKVSTFTSNTFFSSVISSQSDTEHQCALHLNDMWGSLLRKLHFGCHTLSL